VVRASVGSPPHVIVLNDTRLCEPSRLYFLFAALFAMVRGACTGSPRCQPGRFKLCTYLEQIGGKPAPTSQYRGRDIAG